jgi:hypothetical protein
MFEEQRLLDLVRNILHLRLEYEWPDPDSLHLALRRFWPAGCRRRLDPCDDGHIRSLRHDRLWLSDRYDSRMLLFWYYGLRGLSLLYLPYSGFSVFGLSFFSVFYGLDWIATVPPTVRLTTQIFGKEKAGVAFGWIFAAHQLGAATAAFGAGLSRTEWNTYLPAFFVAGAACLIASASVWFIGARKRETATVAA